MTTIARVAIVLVLLLILTTPRRLALLVFFFLAWTPAAYAWSWPVQGPVVQPFNYSEAHPYAAGQHRGVDIVADAAGETVVAPAAGTVSFAGTVAANGKTVTIETVDGYSVTVTHLGSISVGKGATVAEQDAIGTVGPSGTPEVDAPYVHLGIRVTDDPNGYVDPLTLLPPAAGGDSSAPPQASSGSAAAPVKKPRSSAPKTSNVVAAPASAQSSRSHVRVREDQPADGSHSSARTTWSEHRPAVRTERDAGRHAEQEPEHERTSSIRRPLVDPTALGATPGLGLHAPLFRPESESSPSVLGLVCNGAAALCALGAALAAGRRRRPSKGRAPAPLLHLPVQADAGRDMSRAA